MKEFLKLLYKKLYLIISITFIMFFVGYFVRSCINYYGSYYSCTFSCNETISDEELVNLDYLESIKNSATKYSNIDLEKMLRKDGFTIDNLGNDRYEIKTDYKYYDIFFNSKSKTTGTRAKTFIKDAIDGLFLDVTYDDPTNIVVRMNYHNDEWLFGLIFALGSAIISICILAILIIKKKDNINDFIYDNESTYKTIFHKRYWKDAISSVRSIKDITTIAMLFALMLACKFIPIPSGWGNLGISFTFLFFALIGLIYGPIYGFAIGILSDVIGYFINSTGVFFLGYTLQAALTGMIYGLCFYKTKVNFSKVLLSRLLVNMLMNVVLGSICYTMVFSDASWFSDEFNEYLKAYALYLSLPKNIFYLVPQSILLFIIIKSIAPVLYRFKLMEKETYNHISIL